MCNSYYFKTKDMDKSRRQFLSLSAAALAGVTLVPSLVSCKGAKADPEAASDGKISSTFNGVAIGTITYSYRGMQPGLENLIKTCKDSLISNLELMGGDLEGCLGIPENPRMRIMQQAMAAQRPAAPAATAQRPGGAAPGGAPGGAPAGGPGGPGGMRGFTFTPEQQAEIDKYNEDVKNFRRNMDWGKVEAIRKRFEDEGISIHIVKTQPSGYTDPEDIDYAFKLAKAMGAVGVTDELSQEAVEKIAPYAEKHDMFYIMHNHMQYATEE